MKVPHRRQAHVHGLVVETAKELCLALYEDSMKNNTLRENWKRKHPGMSEQGLIASWLRRYIRAHIPLARATLTTMLSGPYDDAYKERIYEALLLDNSLVRGRSGALQKVKEMIHG